MAARRGHESKDGEGQTVRICKVEAEWVSAPGLVEAWSRAGLPGLPKSGDVLRVLGARSESGLERTEVRRVTAVDAVRVRHVKEGADLEPSALPEAGEQVLLVTDTRARAGFWDRARGGCFWALGTVLDEELAVTKSARTRFFAACAGSDDRRQLEGLQREGKAASWRRRAEYVDATWWALRGQRRVAVARRTRSSGFLFAGDVVWVKLSGREVIDMRLSQIWRRPGETKAESRLPGEGTPARPGTKPLPCVPTTDERGATSDLCLACAVFGAVDANGERRARGRQDAYATHVRFSAARPVSRSRLQKVDLTPMGAPKPGSGPFYLEVPAVAEARQGDVGDIAAQWGSRVDSPPRTLRGRKFYWHSDPDEQARHWSETTGRRVGPRYEASASQRSKSRMTRAADLVAPSGSEPLRLRSTVTFDQLDELGVRSLLAALQPDLLLSVMPQTPGHTPEYALHLGGGKPLGLGTVVPRIVVEESRITSLAGRYSEGTDEASPDWWGPPRDWVPRMQTRVGRITGHLPILARMLDTGGLGEWEKLVSYPPAAPWTEANTDDFRSSYEFFTQANGEALAGRTRPWWPLPRPSASGDPSLPILRKERRRR